MKKIITLSLITLFTIGFAMAQTGLYVPASNAKKKTSTSSKNKAQEPSFPKHPETFYMLVKYTPGDTTYHTSDLDVLDSAYSIAFADRSNPMMYTMTIESYSDADGNEEVSQSRANMVAKYFSARCHAPFPIRYASNRIHCSCHGDTTEILRYEVPTTTFTYNYSQLPESRRLLNGNIRLEGSVLVTFRNNPDECLGYGRGCFLPGQDTTIRGYYTSLQMNKGSVYAVDNTMDTCPPALNINIEEHLDYKKVVERYALIPHRKQILLQVGYVVLHSNFNRAWDECDAPLVDSIFIQFPANQTQWDNKLRIFAKKYTEKGPEFKSLSTKKIKGPKGSDMITMQAAISPAQFDTIYLGKRIQPEEIKDYLYEVKTNMEEGTITLDGKYYKAYKIGNHGEYEIKKPLRALMRIVEEQEEFDEPKDAKNEEIE
ncbi:MAG: hypothetical protein MJZ51_04915 [Bacteroidales bacterium]|nr:hypothetical protein [Bacteroidales bacterium]